jgi:hypothetical protein
MMLWVPAGRDSLTMTNNFWRKLLQIIALTIGRRGIFAEEDALPLHRNGVNFPYSRAF